MTNVSRRDWMTWALAAAGMLPFEDALGATRRTPRHVAGPARRYRRRRYEAAGTEPDSLNGIARSKGLRFGSCIGTGPTKEQTAAIAAILKANPSAAENLPLSLRIFKGRVSSFDDPRMRALFVSQCGILVPANELKWYAIRWKPGVFDFRRADTLIDFASKHQLAVLGHTLLWNRTRWTPEWVTSYDFGAAPASAAEKMLREHIATVCNRYGERIFSYDVINETISPDTGELEDSVFTKLLGPNVVDICFHAAREAAPHAQLVYNDYMSWGQKSAVHRAAVLKLLERMKAANVPVDALGIQAHIGSDGMGTAVGLGPDEAEWRKFLDAVTAMGLDLVITEFDVNDKYVDGSCAERDRIVADYGKAYLDIMLSYPQLRYVMAWGLVDKYSWLQNTSPRPDGLPKRPTPYDDDFEPKPLHEAMAAVFAAAPARPEMTMKPA